jgi:hypothetical protein
VDEAVSFEEKLELLVAELSVKNDHLLNGNVLQIFKLEEAVLDCLELRLKLDYSNKL